MLSLAVIAVVVFLVVKVVYWVAPESTPESADDFWGHSAEWNAAHHA